MKNILKIATFGACLIILLCILSAVFNGGDLASEGKVIYYDRRVAELSNQPKGEIEVLCVGDSLCGAGFNSPSLYRDYGITSYNMGKEMQRSIESYYCIKEALKDQPVKVVLWETHNLTKKYEWTDRQGYELGEALRNRFEFLKYHSFWKFFVDGRSIRKYFKGFIVDETVGGYDGAVPYYNLKDTTVFPINPYQDRMLTKVKELCDQNGIRLVLVSFVSPKCYYYQMHTAFGIEAQERGIDYLDLNCELDKMDMDWKNDFYDNGDHVNLTGSEKMMSCLGEYLSKECGLTDHRGDPAYSSWEEMLAGYRQEVIDMEGTDYFIVEDNAGIQRQIRYMTPMDSDKYADDDEE